MISPALERIETSCVGVAWGCSAKEKTRAEKRWHRIIKKCGGYEWSGIALEKL